MIKDECVVVEVDADIHIKNVKCHNMTIHNIDLKEKIKSSKELQGKCPVIPYFFSVKFFENTL